MTCTECQAGIRKWLDYQPPTHDRRWKGQCCTNRADDNGNGACPRCRMSLDAHREKRDQTVRNQISIIRRICETRHQENA